MLPLLPLVGGAILGGIITSICSEDEPQVKYISVPSKNKIKFINLPTYYSNDTNRSWITRNWNWLQSHNIRQTRLAAKLARRGMRWYIK